MSRFRRFELIEQPFPLCYSSPFQTLPFPSFPGDSLDLDLDLLLAPSHFDAVADLLHAPALAYRRAESELRLQSLGDRVAELESRFDRLLAGDRKYTWTAEIKGAEKEWDYQWTDESYVGGEKNEKKVVAGCFENRKWTAEISGKGEDQWELTEVHVSGGKWRCQEEEEGEGECEGERRREHGLRVVEIREPGNHRDEVLRQAFAKRFGAVQNNRGKKKDWSPQDAALLIQISFRAYLIRRSKALRALRELAVAKSKLKEIRAQFNNFSYRRHIARDAEERQRFSEKIIVLLLTVEAIEGGDIMVRSAKRSMVDELEAMLDVVDPQPGGRSASLSFKRRTFDMPDGVIRKEIEEGVAQVVQMLEEAENSSNTYEP
uniref:BCL-2-associated athanogene 7 n=1 Tax=Phaseolus vulgaris TaxID=3885 RepID=T2DNA2_PHAVU|nr:BCL-2-associated athanogene 7 [Phaseolus vulgaris]